jgi:hypothetical protein
MWALELVERMDSELEMETVKGLVSEWVKGLEEDLAWVWG